VPTLAVMFALLAGVSVATWTVCLKLGATKINVAARHRRRSRRGGRRLHGFLALHEPVTPMRLFALGLIACGILLLPAQGG